MLAVPWFCREDSWSSVMWKSAYGTKAEDSGAQRYLLTPWVTVQNLKVRNRETGE